MKFFLICHRFKISINIFNCIFIKKKKRNFILFYSIISLHCFEIHFFKSALQPSIGIFSVVSVLVSNGHFPWLLLKCVATGSFMVSSSLICFLQNTHLKHSMFGAIWESINPVFASMSTLYFLAHLVNVNFRILSFISKAVIYHVRYLIMRPEKLSDNSKAKSLLIPHSHTLFDKYVRKF